MSESIIERSFSISVSDPYAAAHEAMHNASRWGKVIERVNRLLTTGPTTTAELRFNIEHTMDKFTHMHISFDMTGDVMRGNADVTIKARLECTLPTPHGMASKTFNEFYFGRLWPRHLEVARDTAGSAISELERRMSARA